MRVIDVTTKQVVFTHGAMYPAGATAQSIDAAALRAERAATAAENAADMLGGRITVSNTITAVNSPNGEVHLIPSGGVAYAATSARFAPGTASDNSQDLGGAARRWATVYAGTGTISTSDERSKQDISEFPDEVLDAWGLVDWRQYRFRDSVADKGEFARKHAGLIAQRVVEAFEAYGLDAMEWGAVCFDEWHAQDAVTERSEDGDDQVEVSPEIEDGSLYGIRYEEALSIEAAYQRRRADRIESRLAAIEARLDGVEGG